MIDLMIIFNIFFNVYVFVKFLMVMKNQENKEILKYFDRFFKFYSVRI